MDPMDFLRIAPLTKDNVSEVQPFFHSRCSQLFLYCWRFCEHGLCSEKNPVYPTVSTKLLQRSSRIDRSQSTCRIESKHNLFYIMYNQVSRSHIVIQCSCLVLVC